MQPRELALFSGAGGGLLAARALGWKTVCAVELDQYCRDVICARQEEGILDAFDVYRDVREFDGGAWRDQVEIVSAGFPCQPFSGAGRGDAEDDERNLWPETIRVIREVGPRIAFLENVPALLAKPYFGTILGELACAGFDAEWMVLGADDVGAPHRRKRLWILAYANGAEVRHEPERGPGTAQEALAGDAQSGDHGPQGQMAHPHRGGLSGLGQSESTRLRGSSWDEPHGCRRTIPGPQQQRLEGRLAGLDHPPKGWQTPPGFGPNPARPDWWASEPDVGRVADGVASRVDRLKALGNGQVPLVAAIAFRMLEGCVNARLEDRRILV